MQQTVTRDERAEMIESSHDAILARDLDDRIIYWSRGAQELYGWTPGEAAGCVAHDLLKTRYPSARDEARRALLEAGCWEGPLTQTARSGAEVVVDSRQVLRRDGQGAPLAVYQFDRDITLAARSEEALTRARRWEALGVVAVGIAHDFNNLLAAISGNAKLAAADLAPSSPAQVSLAEIVKAGDRATELARQILVFSRPQQEQRQPVQLAAPVEEALKLMRAALPPSIRIDSEYSRGVPDVVCDESLVEQAMVNLLANAAQAIRQRDGGELSGQITVRVDTADIGPGGADPGGEPMRADGELRAGRYVRLTVSDDGCGMDQAALDGVFAPLFTLNPPGQPASLGLSIVRGIMRNHAGAVTVRSQPGRGATFHLYFPAFTSLDAQTTAAPAAAELARAETPPAEDARPEAARGQGERLLFVDDEDALVFLARRMLVRLGYRVTGFTDPILALEEFRARPRDFDVVITDLSMPGMSGIDLARALREARPDVPILMVSGYIQPEYEEEARQAGVRAVILKPNTVDEFGLWLDQLFQDIRKSGQASGG
jgi:PAS domain S-box-containing protein